MVRQFKRQKITNNVNFGVLVPPTKYSEPNEDVSSSGYASSILNGNTTEGGLKSLTHKSINAVRLLENLDLIRKTLIKDPHFELSRVTTKNYATPELIKELKNEVSKARESNGSRNHTTDEKIESLNSLLDTEISQKQLPESYGEKVVDYYKTGKPDVTLNITSKDYEFVKNVDLTGIHIDRFEDLKDPDFAAVISKEAESNQITPDQSQSAQTNIGQVDTANDTADASVRPIEDISLEQVTDQILLSANYEPSPEQPQGNTTLSTHSANIEAEISPSAPSGDAPTERIEPAPESTSTNTDTIATSNDVDISSTAPTTASTAPGYHTN